MLEFDINAIVTMILIGYDDDDDNEDKMIGMNEMKMAIVIRMSINVIMQFLQMLKFSCMFYDNSIYHLL